MTFPLIFSSFLLLFAGSSGRIPDGSNLLHLHPTYYSQPGLRTVIERPSANERETRPSDTASLWNDAKQRSRRDASVPNQEILTKILANDSHNLAMILWTSNVSDTIIVVTRDSPTRSSSYSNLYVSHDYGVSFALSNDQIAMQGSTKLAIEEVYQSQADKTRYIFVDTRDKYIVTTTDDAMNFTAAQVTWMPYYLIPHPTKPDYVMAYDNNADTLYLSKDFCQTWSSVARRVAPSFDWGVPGIDSDSFFVFQQYQGAGSSSKSNVMQTNNLFQTSPTTLVTGIDEFRIVDEYMFAVNSSATSNALLVSYTRAPFKQAQFPTDTNGIKLTEKEYFIADASEGQVFVAVNHATNSTNLYISQAMGHRFSLSLERALYHNPRTGTSPSWYNRYVPFRLLDFERIAALRGVYVATQLEIGQVGQRPLRTVISFDKGGEWTYVTAPLADVDNVPINCFLPDCSLHLAQEWVHYNPYSRAEEIFSSPQAPGLIIATGMLGKTVRFSYDIYLSNNGGVTWQQSLPGENYYNMGDHGGVIVAIDKFQPTNHIMFTVDEGLTWKRKNFSQFDVYAYGIVAEPGERSTVFSVYGDYPGKREWVIVRVDLRGELGNDCAKKDYAQWHPSDERTEEKACILGRDYVYERRRRTTACFNGRNYDRAVSSTNCSCGREDYECDFGFEMNSVGDPCLASNGRLLEIVPPVKCAGTYAVSKGYRKVAGDTCSGGEEALYSPVTVPCPQSASITSDLQLVNSQLIGRANTPITFTVTSNADISSALFHWDFGDQNVKIGQGYAFAKVQHSYSTLGRFVVHVSVIMPSFTQYAFLDVSTTAPFSQQTVSIAMVPETPSVGEGVVLFAKLANQNASMSGLQYTWTFVHSHLSTVTMMRPQGFLKYTFTTAGSWKISVAVTNGNGKLSSQTTLTVADFLPQDVTLSVHTASDIIVNWQPPPEGTVASYAIQIRSISGNSAWSLLDSSISPGQLTYLATKLKANTKYQFEVRAYTTDGKSGPWGFPVAATTKPAASSAPTNVRVNVNKKTGTAFLLWDQPSQINGKITGYVINTYVSNGNQNGTQTSTTLSATVGGLQRNVNYYFSVIAVTSPNIRSPPSAFTKGINITSPPSTPTDVRFYNHGYNSIGFRWKAPVTLPTQEFPTGYNASLFLNGKLVSSTTVFGTLYLFSQLKPNTQYQFQVAAYNSAGSSSPTALYSASTLETVPGAPERVRVLTINSTTITVTFVLPPLRFLNGNPKNCVITETDPGGAQKTYTVPVAIQGSYAYVVTGLMPYTTYEFALAIVNDKGQTGTASPAVKNTTAEAIPSAPVNVRSTPMTLTSIMIQWSRPIHLNGKLLHFKVQIVKQSQNNTSGERKIYVVRGNQMNVTAFNLKPNVIYGVWVSASTSKGYSSLSDPIEASAVQAPLGTSEVHVDFPTGVDAALQQDAFQASLLNELTTLTGLSSSRFQGITVAGTTVVFYLLPPTGSDMSNDEVTTSLTTSVKKSQFQVSMKNQKLIAKSIKFDDVPTSGGYNGDAVTGTGPSATTVIVGCVLAVVVIGLLIGLVVLARKHWSTKHHYSVLATTGSLSFRNEAIDGDGAGDDDEVTRSRKQKKEKKSKRRVNTDNDDDDDDLLVA